MSQITAKQRRNAERELTSVVCAGCDGPKHPGSPYCRSCYRLLMEQRNFPLLGPIFFAEKYTEGLSFLLSPRGQRLRAAM